MSPVPLPFDDLGSALLLLREDAALTQVQVAERTGIAQGRLSRYENDRKSPDVSTLNRLLVCYGADVERLARALKEVRDKRVAKSPASDPELTARVKEVLLQLGYPVPGPSA
ncbi:MAG: helix-turn-helix domain-containing protein [Thermoanaerobaculia bacterium]